jgi:hypothetical protein
VLRATLRVIGFARGLKVFEDGLNLLKPAFEAEQGGNIVATPIAASTVNGESFRTIQEWIRLCDTRHPECRQRMHSTERKLPKQLLDVKCDRESSEESSWLIQKLCRFLHDISHSVTVGLPRP